MILYDHVSGEYRCFPQSGLISHDLSIGFCSRQPLYVDCASKICNSDPFKVQVMRLEGNPAVVSNVLGTEPATFTVAFISFDFFSFDH